MSSLVHSSQYPANALIHETSPYLLQHAHNPVQWQPWGDKALAQAKQENKLLLISIGYSACHWCHVMERESFEDQATADIMNAHYICIKVDREERPDVDQVYMHAVQLLTGQGGWPLNCFALPDGRPVYGGTYFQNRNWKEILQNLASAWVEEPAKVITAAEQLTKGLQRPETPLIEREPAPFNSQGLRAMYGNWREYFDRREGGPNRAPKFPLPNNYQFLLRFAILLSEESALRQVKLTLEKMAYGGIYDQIGGGFARYSTDALWKAPHFEKMLYDNGQLLELYAEAYQAIGEPLYRDIVYGIKDFIVRELTSPEGGFYSALDADSEGEEGKYYVWSEAELKALLGDDFALAQNYFNVNEKGLWEHGQYILLRYDSDNTVAQSHGLTLEEMAIRIENINTKLLMEREKRIKPGLDDKMLISWNALAVLGLTKAYKAFGDEIFLQLALKNAHTILFKAKTIDGGLWHSAKNQEFTIQGFLEDYAFTMEAFIALYEVTFDLAWVEQAAKLMDYVWAHFEDENSALFYFTSNTATPLVARKKETQDNVIPASNSSLAKSLFWLGHFLDRREYCDRASRMLAVVQRELPIYGSSYSNWAQLFLQVACPFYQVVIVGNQAEAMRKELSSYFLPQILLAGCEQTNSYPLFKDRGVEGKTLFYVCKDGTCSLPVENIFQVLEQLKFPAAN